MKAFLIKYNDHLRCSHNTIILVWLISHFEISISRYCYQHTSVFVLANFSLTTKFFTLDFNNISPLASTKWNNYWHTVDAIEKFLSVGYNSCYWTTMQQSRTDNRKQTEISSIGSRSASGEMVYLFLSDICISGLVGK